MADALLRLLCLSALMAVAGIPVLAAEPSCTATRMDMVDRLGDRWNERQLGVGLDHRGVAVMLFLSPEGTFTVTYSSLDGTTCIVSAGTDMQIADPAAVFEGEGGTDG